MVIVSGNVAKNPSDAPPSEGEPFLVATDEVQLEWWAENKAPESHNPQTEPSYVDVNMESDKAVKSEENYDDTKDYSGLMADYIEKLQHYLKTYFHITPHKMEDS
jgi:hypothetical protein